MSYLRTTFGSDQVLATVSALTGKSEKQIAGKDNAELSQLLQAAGKLGTQPGQVQLSHASTPQGLQPCIHRTFE